MSMNQEVCPLCQHPMELVDTNTDMTQSSKLEWQCVCGHREAFLSTKEYRKKFGED